MDTERQIRAITNSGSNLSDQLELSLTDVRSLDIIVSFVKHSGIRMIRPILQDLSEKGVPVRIMTSTYLGITDPFALEMLLSMKDSGVDVRLFDQQRRSFHPKSYIIHHNDGSTEVFIGSSNISRSAFVDGVEWNYRLDSGSDPESVKLFSDEFDRLFTDHSVILTDDIVSSYRSSWRRPVLSGSFDIERDVPKKVFEPTGAQQVALDSLQATRKEGNDRALVVMATGTGKTVLAAMDSKDFNTVLFIAHRKEILRQAKDTFVTVRGLDPDRDCGFFFAEMKQPEKDFLFASIGTLCRDANLKDIDLNRYEYVVVDEFHHAAANSYRKVLNLLKPKFLLGLTATPDRMDSEDVRVLCNDNVPYEIHMQDAIRFGYLVPFDYWGISDDSIDYSKVRFTNGRYDSNDLVKRYRRSQKRNDLIRDNYLLRAGERTLAFCANRQHAKDMKEYFESNGIRSRIIVSNSLEDGIVSDDRELSVKELVDGEVDVIFTVDVFNEGVDIPQVDTVMFLRPTESETIFLQQLGRGLRLSEGKERLTVIDFIGNYHNADKIPNWITGRRYNVGEIRRIGKRAPFGCNLNFDMRSIDIMEELRRKNSKLRDLIAEQYLLSKRKRGHRPTRLELLEDFDQGFLATIRNRSVSPFKDYLHFIEEMGDLTPIERTFLGRESGELFHIMETTQFSKMYKAALLYSLYNDGDMRISATTDEIIQTFREFYSHPENWFDARHLGDSVDSITRSKWVATESQPRKHLNDDESGFFIDSKDSFSLDPIFSDLIGVSEFKEHFRDILDHRVEDFRRFRGRNDP